MNDRLPIAGTRTIPRSILAVGLVLLAIDAATAQVQHPLAARRVRVHRVHEHRENVVGAVHDRRVNAVDRVQEHRQDVANVRQERAENVVARRTAVAAARTILPAYAPATIAASGSIVVPAAPVATTAPPAAPPAGATLEPAEEADGSESDPLPDQFEGSPSYAVSRLEDGGITAVLKVGQGETKVRMVGVAAIALADKVAVPERFAGMRLPSTERFVENLLKGESVYVVYDSHVAEEDADKKCVAYLFRAPDGLPVNLEVIRAGFAVVDNRYPFDQKQVFNDYQEKAKKAEKGIYGILQRLSAAKAEKQK